MLEMQKVFEIHSEYVDIRVYGENVEKRYKDGVERGLIKPGNYAAFNGDWEIVAYRPSFDDLVGVLNQTFGIPRNPFYIADPHDLLGKKF